MKLKLLISLVATKPIFVGLIRQELRINALFTIIKKLCKCFALLFGLDFPWIPYPISFLLQMKRLEI